MSNATPAMDELRYRALLQHSSDMMLLLDDGGNIRFASPSCTRILGYSAHELLGRLYLSLVHPAESAAISAVMLAANAKPADARSAEFRSRHADGSWRWLEFTCTNLLAEPGVGSIVVNARDISGRVHVKAERQVFLEVMQALSAAPNLQNALSQVHQSLKQAMYADNCLLVLHNAATNKLETQFFVSQVERTPSAAALRNSCAALVFRTGQPMLIRGDDFEKLAASGQVKLAGKRPSAWLGVPLRTPAALIGVLAVQHYEDANAYSQEDLTFLDGVGGQIAHAVERWDVAATLHRQQQENEIIFHSAPYMIWYKDSKNRILRANRSAAQFMGMDIAQVEGSSLYDLFPSEAVQYHQDDLEVIRTGNSKLGIIQPLRSNSGDLRLMRTDKIPYRDSAGNITGVVVFFTDITERQRAEDAMRRSEGNYRSVVEGAPYGICRVSDQGRFFDVNPALVEMLGYSSSAELLDTNLDDAIFRDAQERARITKDSGETFEGAEVTWRRKDGKQIQVCLSGRPVRDPEWPSTSYELMAEDVTEQRTLETQLRQVQKMEAVGRLAGGVAHDFNNLLMVIQGHTELLLDRELQSRSGKPRAGADAALFAKVEQIQKAAERASALTRQLLAFSRMQVLQAKVIELTTVVSDMARMLPRLIGEDITLEVTAGADVGCVKADASQIEQVILNLAVNARDAMPNGGRLTIHTANAEVAEPFARMHPPLAAGPYVVLTVSDTGVGMDAETQVHIFEPFFTTKEVGKGTGLGLATVYGVVKQSGGYISVTSQKSAGTTFAVYLPRAQRDVEQPHAALPAEKTPQRSETILVAEDEADVRDIAREFLALSGYTVLEARNGADALEIARRHRGPIHLLITDVVMPKVGGHELAAKMAELRPETKVIYMSGYAERAVAPPAGQNEKSILLTKPFTRAALTGAVNQVLQAVPVK